jgi:DUF4097 and DUF4098 domain-containing protein YvlB
MAGVVMNVRTAWISVGSVAAVGLLVMGGCQAIGVLARETRTVQDSISLEGVRTIEVYSDNGNVRIIGNQRTGLDTPVPQPTTAAVTIEITESLRAVETTVTRRGDLLRLEATCPGFGGAFCEADYVVRVPARDIAVIARSDNGNASVERVQGGATVSSSNGDVRAELSSGRLDMSTDNGDVTGINLFSGPVSATSSNGDVELTFGGAPASLSATSDNGDVVVQLPPGEELYAVDATSDNGEVKTPVRTDPASRRTVVARSDNGDVIVRYA